MIKQLHPSLKKCACGYIGTKRELYKHFEDIQRTMKAMGESPREFWAGHGEVPLNVDDPKLNLETQLKRSLETHQLSGGFRPDFADQIPSGHRLDDNNTEYPTK